MPAYQGGILDREEATLPNPGRLTYFATQGLISNAIAMRRKSNIRTVIEVASADFLSHNFQ